MNWIQLFQGSYPAALVPIQKTQHVSFMAQGAKSMASNLFLVNSVSWCVIKDDGVWIYTLPGPFSLFKLHTSLPACELDWVILHQNADVRVVYWRSYSSIDSIEQIPHHRSVGRQDIPSLPFPSLPKRNETKRSGHSDSSTSHHSAQQHRWFHIRRIIGAWRYPQCSWVRLKTYCVLRLSCTAENSLG